MCRAIVTTFGGIMQTHFVTSRIFIKCPSRLKSSEAAISVDFPHNSSSRSSVCFVKLLNRRLCYFSATGNSRRPDAVYSKLFLFLGLNILFVVGASLHWRFLQSFPVTYVNVINCWQMSCCSYRSCNFKENWQNCRQRQVKRNKFLFKGLLCKPVRI